MGLALLRTSEDRDYLSLRSSLRFICAANSEVPAVARRYTEHNLWVVKTKTEFQSELGLAS
jgi:hypothetical protein